MEEIVINELTHEGMRRVRVMGDSPFTPSPQPSPEGRGGRRWERGIPLIAMDRLQVVNSHDETLGLYMMELTWPVFEPVDILNFGPRRFRRLMMVHYSYAERVSECIRLGVEEFMVRTRWMPGYAFISEIPNGAEDCMHVHGVELLQSEWMPQRCVAIGGHHG